MILHLTHPVNPALFCQMRTSRVFLFDITVADRCSMETSYQNTYQKKKSLGVKMSSKKNTTQTIDSFEIPYLVLTKWIITLLSLSAGQ